MSLYHLGDEFRKAPRGDGRPISCLMSLTGSDRGRLETSREGYGGRSEGLHRTPDRHTERGTRWGCPVNMYRKKEGLPEKRKGRVDSR